jgi:MurNAc alpha-1-phosphate uridylyltransferase
MKAMILAAGRGQRMQALTEHTPKPLLLVAGKPLIVHQLIALVAAGITDVVINVSYLADKLQQTLGDGREWGVNIQYSVEPQVLETGGGIYQALPLLGDEHFIVLSADIYTDYPWQRFLKSFSNAALAHLVLVDNPEYHPLGDFCLQNNTVHLTGNTRLTYANIGIYHPRLFKNCESGFFKLADVLNPAIAAGHVTGEHYQGLWYNVGTPETLQQLNR